MSLLGLSFSSILTKIVKRSECVQTLSFRQISCTQSLREKDDRGIWKKSLPAPEEGIKGLNLPHADPLFGGICDFPDGETPSKVMNGLVFSSIPVLHIHVTKNNTKFVVNDTNGKTLFKRTCGYEGFKNCRKGTTVAAQTTAMSLCKVALKQGITTVRACVKGLGPGRLASIQGLVQGGLQIVSISDTTDFMPHPWKRPRKARRL